MSINWVSKAVAGRSGWLGRDVALSLGTRSKGKVTASITIRNRKGKMLAPSDHIIIGIDGTRLYFKNDEKGYKLAYRNSETCSFCLSIPEVIRFCKEHSGEYDLNRDKAENCWFIETNVNPKFETYK